MTGVLSSCPNKPPWSRYRNVTSKWPWKKTKLSIKELTAGGGNCKKWASEIQKVIGGKKKKILPDIPDSLIQRGQGFISKVFNKSGQLITDEWKFHEAVFKNNKVFDRITGPSGMHIDDYKKLFEWSDDLNFKIME